MGQAPDRQAALFAGLPTSVPCTAVNKVIFYRGGRRALVSMIFSLSISVFNHLRFVGVSQSIISNRISRYFLVFDLKKVSQSYFIL